MTQCSLNFLPYTDLLGFFAFFLGGGGGAGAVFFQQLKLDTLRDFSENIYFLTIKSHFYTC